MGWGFLSQPTQSTCRCQGFLQDGSVPASEVVSGERTYHRAYLRLCEIDNALTFIQVNVREENVRLSSVAHFVPACLPFVSRVPVYRLLYGRF